MALIFRGSTACPLCGRVIEAEDDIVATSHFLGPEHPLWRYSDAAMHRACFLTWEHRAEFIAAFNTIVGPLVFGNRTSHRMSDDGSIQVIGDDA